MRRAVVSTLVTHPSDTPADDDRRSFAGLLEFLDNAEGGVELAATGAHLSLSPEQVRVLREVFSAAATGQDFVMLHDVSRVAAAEVEKAYSRHGLSALVAYFASADEAPALMSSQEVADVLNVSRPFVVKLARSGKLPHTKVGNRHRFKASDVAAHAEGMRSEREAALREMVPEGGYTSDDF